MMQKTLREIADIVSGEVVGNGDLIIRGIAGIEEAQEGDITFLANPKYLSFIDKTKASAIITSRQIDSAAKPIVRVENPSLAFIKVASMFAPSEAAHPAGISAAASVAKGSVIGKLVSIGAFAVIEDKAAIGDKTVIYPGCFIGKNTRIGNNCLIYSNVSIRENAVIGDNVIIHSNTVIGSDGFGYVTVDAKHHKIPQQGNVVIEDDVEIGAGVTVDRARFDKTVIGKGTKIDNLVHIAHNVVIGKNCLIIAQVGLSGSTKVGDNVILAGQVGTVGHIEIGNNCIVMAKSGVNKSLPDNSIVWGTPARPAGIAKRISACVQSLPKLFTNVSEMKKRIEELESKIK